MKKNIERLAEGCFVGKRVHKEKNLNRKWELKQQIDDYEANNVSRDEDQEAYERYKQWIRAMEEEDCREQDRMFLVLKSIGELFDPAVLSTIMEMGGARLLKEAWTGMDTSHSASGR